MNILDNSFQEHCGIVGIYTKTYTRTLTLALKAASALQHRGQHGAGMAQKIKTGITTFAGSGLLKEVFTNDIVEKYDIQNRWVIIHCRYGTEGDYHKENLQPCIAYTREKKKIVVAHNGQFTNFAYLKKQLKKHESVRKYSNDTLIFTRLLAVSPERSFDNKLLGIFSNVNGAYSLIIGTGNTLYAARDKFGIRPLIIAKINQGFIIASETAALDKIGVKVLRKIRRGEVLKITPKGIRVLRKGYCGSGHFCDFEWAYFSRPTSLAPTYKNKDDGEYPKRWLSFNAFREKCGQTLAREKPVIHATFVVGIPDSGISVAQGYANELRIPYRQAIIRDHFDRDGLQRLFMRDDQKKTICDKVLGKLSFVPDYRIWNNAIVVIGDDSIVRGNVSSMTTQAIFAQGAKEVHWIVGFPAVSYPCHLGISMRTKEELIAAKYKCDLKKIAQAIGATSVSYISVEGFIRAKLGPDGLKKARNPKKIFLANGGCGGCITGLYPVDKEVNRFRIQSTKT